MASQSHRIRVADSSFSRHPSQVGSSVSPSLKRCPSRWQCPVNSTTIHLSWSLFNFNRSFILLAEGPGISPFACLSPVKHSQCFLCVQSLTTFLATPIEMPQAGSGPVNGCSDPVLAIWSAVSLTTIPSWPGTHISWTLLCLANCNCYYFVVELLVTTMKLKNCVSNRRNKSLFSVVVSQGKKQWNRTSLQQSKKMYTVL
jgi:hypothetical protein